LSIYKISNIDVDGDKSFDADAMAEAELSCDGANIECIQLSKESTLYRKIGLTPGSEYMVALNYLELGSSTPIVADVVTIITNSELTSVKIVEIKEKKNITYNVKLYDEYTFASSFVAKSMASVLVRLINLTKSSSSENVFTGRSEITRR
jgi:hypothetical protein